MSLRAHRLTPGSQCYSLETVDELLLRARRLLQICKPLSKDTPHKIISSGARGSAAPGFREPSRETSRSVGFNPIAHQVIALLRRSPEELGPGSRQAPPLC